MRISPALALVFALTIACGDGDDGPNERFETRGLSTIEIEPSVFSVGLGRTAELRAIGLFDDEREEDLTAQLEWSVQPGGIITLGEPGAITGFALGDATVRATDPDTGVTGAALIRVEPFGQEGTPAEPVAVTTEVPYDGTVNSGRSYYTVDVIPGEAYYVSVSDFTDEIRLEVYDDPARTNPLCDATFALPDEPLECVTDPVTSDDRLYVVVNGAFTDTFFGGDGGSDYRLLIERGYLDEPETVVLTLGEARTSAVGRGSSRFEAAVTPKAEYRIDVTELSAPARATFTGFRGIYYEDFCFSEISGTQSESCQVRADGETLAFTVFGDRDGVGSSFRVQVTETADPLVAEGSVEVPRALTGPGPWNGEVDDSASYYEFDNGAGTGVRIRLEAPQAELSLDVYDGGGAFTGSADCFSSNGSLGEGTIACELPSPASDTVYLRVRGTFAPVGSTFRIVRELL